MEYTKKHAQLLKQNQSIGRKRQKEPNKKQFYYEPTSKTKALILNKKMYDVRVACFWKQMGNKS